MECMNSHGRLVSYIREKDQQPISTSLTQDVLYMRKQMEKHSQTAKEQSQLLMKNICEIGNRIKEVRTNVQFM